MKVLLAFVAGFLLTNSAANAITPQDACADAVHRQLALDIKTELAKAPGYMREEYLRLAACVELNNLRNETTTEPATIVVEMYRYLEWAGKTLKDIGSPDIQTLLYKAYQKAFEAERVQTLAQVKQVEATKKVADDGMKKARLNSDRMGLMTHLIDVTRIARKLKLQAFKPSEEQLIAHAMYTN